jgi:redox-regulated HSP33 family molecular chaperone
MRFPIRAKVKWYERCVLSTTTVRVENIAINNRMAAMKTSGSTPAPSVAMIGSEMAATAIIATMMTQPVCVC